MLRSEANVPKLEILFTAARHCRSQRQQRGLHCSVFSRRLQCALCPTGHSDFRRSGVCTQRLVATISLSAGCKQQVNCFRVDVFRGKRKRVCRERRGPGGEEFVVFNSCGYLFGVYLPLGSTVIRSARGRHWGAGGDQLEREKQALRPSRLIASPRKTMYVRRLVALSIDALPFCQERRAVRFDGMGGQPNNPCRSQRM